VAAQLAGHVAALALNALFLRSAWAVARRDTEAAEADGYAAEKRLFRQSLTYLFLHFGALLADAALRAAGIWGGWT
jgi:protoheme IX farnesyltransferase